MRHPSVQTLAKVLPFLVLAAVSSAQISKPEDGVTIPREADIHAAAADGYQFQPTFLGSSDQQIPGHQPLGYISGTILDQSGAVNTGAEVRLTDESRSSNQKALSGSNGQFRFANVPPGSFLLTVTSPGFSTREFSAALTSGETYLVPPIILAIAPAVTEEHVKGSPLTTVQLGDMQVEEQEKQRVFGVLPNFYVSYDGDAVPLNPKQKFRLAWKSITDPFTVVGVAALAGAEQIGQDGHWQGAQGYFKRLGASYADVATGTFIGSAMLPSVLKQDPRYFYKGTGSIRSRLLHALASPVICKGDNLSWQPNYSNVIGNFASAGISYLYYPDDERNGAGLIMQNVSIRLGEIAFEGVLQEFLIRRLTPHLKNRTPTPQ